jgi:choline dehydrogenase
MGPKNDTSAVVDSRARVHGVTGLRVVDASAFPFCPPGHPMSSICEFASGILSYAFTTNILVS